MSATILLPVKKPYPSDTLDSFLYRIVFWAYKSQIFIMYMYTHTHMHTQHMHTHICIDIDIDIYHVDLQKSKTYHQPSQTSLQNTVRGGLPF